MAPYAKRHANGTSSPGPPPSGEESEGAEEAPTRRPDAAPTRSRRDARPVSVARVVEAMLRRVRPLSPDERRRLLGDGCGEEGSWVSTYESRERPERPLSARHGLWKRVAWSVLLGILVGVVLLRFMRSCAAEPFGAGVHALGLAVDCDPVYWSSTLQMTSPEAPWRAGAPSTEHLLVTTNRSGIQVIPDWEFPSMRTLDTVARHGASA